MIKTVSDVPLENQSFLGGGGGTGSRSGEGGGGVGGVGGGQGGAWGLMCHGRGVFRESVDWGVLGEWGG